MKYIKISTLEYPLYEGDIRLEHPEIMEDQTSDTFPCPNTHSLVKTSEVPEYNSDTQTIIESAPTETNGIWSTQYSIRDFTEEELLIFESIKQVRQDAIDRLKPKNKNSGGLPNAI